MQFYNSNYSSGNLCWTFDEINIKSNTLRRKIASLKVFYSYLKYHNLVDENPFNQLRYQFRTEKILPKNDSLWYFEKYFSHLEQKVTYSKTKYQKKKAERNLLIISLLLSTGIRFPNFVIFILKTLIFQIGLSILWEKARKNVSYF